MLRSNNPPYLYQTVLTLVMLRQIERHCSITATELGRRMAPIGADTVAKTVERLDKLGLIRRSNLEPGVGRPATLTPKGRGVLDEVRTTLTTNHLFLDPQPQHPLDQHDDDHDDD